MGANQPNDYEWKYVVWKNTMLEGDKKRLQETNVTLEAQKKLLTDQNMALSAELARVRQELQQERAQNWDLKYKDSQRVIDRLNRQVNDLKETKERLKSQLEFTQQLWKGCKDMNKEWKEAWDDLHQSSMRCLEESWEHETEAMKQEEKACFWEERTKRVVAMASYLTYKLRMLKESLIPTEQNKCLKALIDQIISEFHHLAERLQGDAPFQTVLG